MKKEYEKPILELIEFEYDVQADASTVDANVGPGSGINWW